ncbi:hypothetical protein RCH15_002980 [Arthrobacter sp. MP_M4]|nr:hypothetical protein [Arthrobacter sp. MP_M4]
MVQIFIVLEATKTPIIGQVAIQPGSRSHP